jgi:hypothetical protein
MNLTNEQIIAIDETLVKMEEHIITVLGQEFFDKWLGTNMIANGIQMIDEDLNPQDLISSGLNILEDYL